MVDRLTRVCFELGVHLAIGVNERESNRPGTLYNTLLIIGPSGLLLKHRKLMPTHHERLFHGIGRGNDLAVADTTVGRVGGLICWEHRMPVARYAIYRGGPQIWVAPTMDDSDVWLSLMRTIAFESGAWVISVCQYIHGEQFPDDFPFEIPAGETGSFHAERPRSSPVPHAKSLPVRSSARRESSSPTAISVKASAANSGSMLSGTTAARTSSSACSAQPTAQGTVGQTHVVDAERRHRTGGVAELTL